MVVEEHARLEILLPSEENWRNIGENDIIQGSLSITQKCMDDSAFSLGGVYSAQMSAKVRITGENVNSYTVTGAKVNVYSWYGSDRAQERLRGVFWVTSVAKNGDIFTFSASDALIWLDSSSYVAEDGSGNPLHAVLGARGRNLVNKLKEILEYVNQVLDDDKKLSVYQTNVIINHYTNQVGYSILPTDIIGEISTKNPRDFVAWLGEIACGFVFMDYGAGVPRVRIGQFGEDIGEGMGNEILWDEVELNSCEIADFTLNFSHVRATVYTGKTEYSSLHDADGMVIDLSDNPFKDDFWHYNWQDCHVLLENIIQKLVSEKVNFRPFSLKCHCAKFFELGQKIRLPDGRTSTLTSIKWLFRGGYALSCTGKDTRILSVSAKRSLATKVKDLAFTKINAEIAQVKKNISGGSSLNMTDMDNKINQLRQETDNTLNYYFSKNDKIIDELDKRVHADWMRLKINVISLKKYVGGVFGAERIIARGAFSAFDGAWIFLHCTLVLSGSQSATVKIFVNNVLQTVMSKDLIHNCEQDWHFTMPISTVGDTEQVVITFDGTAEIADIQAFAWGQGLTGQPLDSHENNDYIYQNDDGVVTVQRYVGENISPQIPDSLGGGVTKIIEKSAFSGTAVESVYIPDGVSEIR